MSNDQDQQVVYEIGVDGATDQPISNTLEKGRYVITTKEITPFVANSTGNKCIKGVFVADGVKIHKNFVIKDVNDKPHQMAYQWKQYLYAIGLRDKRTSWTVKNTDLMVYHLLIMKILTECYFQKIIHVTYSCQTLI